MKLLSDHRLERSAVVANCRMNRERVLSGSNGYDKEIGFHPVAFLTARIVSGRPASWLDLCCGTGKALLEAATLMDSKSLEGEIVGVDLVGMFPTRDPAQARPRLVEAASSAWRPDRHFDLITCVHGLHYVGDKLGLMARAVSWLSGDGLFVANFDLANLKAADGRALGRRVTGDLRRAGIAYNRRRRLVVCQGRRDLSLPYRYLGGDDRAGPDYTGQPAVDSYYERVPSR